MAPIPIETIVRLGIVFTRFTHGFSLNLAAVGPIIRTAETLWRGAVACAVGKLEFLEHRDAKESGYVGRRYCADGSPDVKRRHPHVDRDCQSITRSPVSQTESVDDARVMLTI